MKVKLFIGPFCITIIGEFWIYNDTLLDATNVNFFKVKWYTVWLPITIPGQIPQIFLLFITKQELNSRHNAATSN